MILAGNVDDLNPQPKEGDDINVVGGPANGRVTQWTGEKLIYLEHRGGSLDSTRQHLYITVEKINVATGERIWVYEYADYD